MVRAIIPAALATFVATSVAHADPPRPPEVPQVPHGAAWFTAWSLIVTGGTATITGAALSANEDPARPGLTPAAVAGWSTLVVGTALWIVGALVLRADDLRPAARVAFDPASGTLRF